MKFKRSVIILLCLMIAFSSFGCIDFLSEIFADELAGIFDDINTSVYETAAPEEKDSSYPSNTGIDEDEEDEDLPEPHELDMSSAEAFITDVKSIYNVTLRDNPGHLSGPDGDFLMRELDRALSSFSAGFIRSLVEEYREYGSAFIISLEGSSTTEFGMTLWDGDLTIILHYDADPDENGVTAAVLAHELAHAAHFIIEEYIGETRSMMELRSFNGIHSYVGEDYEEIWDPDIHSFYFSYDYGMYDYYEDFATIIEMLVAFPAEMQSRLSDKRHEPLILKTIYIRDIMHYYVSYTDLFTFLNETEAFGKLPAA